MREHYFLSSVLLLFIHLLGRPACVWSYEEALRQSLNEWSISQRDPGAARSLQQQDDAAAASSDICHVCGAVDGLDLMEDAEISTGSFFNMTCQEADAYLSSSGWTPDSTVCLGSQLQLMLPCCNATGTTERVTTYACEDKVHSEVVAAANPDVVPLPSGQRGRLNVTIHIEYFHLTELSTQEGTAEIYVRLWMDWVDERLQWDPTTFGGCSETTVRASLDRELTSIWVPGVDLLNRVQGINSFDEAAADVYANGRVRWQRLGPLKALCSFTGLERFPYDTLGCSFTIGNPQEKNKVRLVLGVVPIEGITGVPGLLISPGLKPKYQEFAVVEDMARVDESFPPSGWAYDFVFYFRRASRHYVQTLVVPTILFTFVSFGMFFLDQRHGERLGYGVTFLLVLVAQGIATADLLPVCKEILWANRLTNASYCWVVGGIFESIICAALFWMEEGDTRRKEEAGQRDADGTPESRGNQHNETSENEADPNSVLNNGERDVPESETFDEHGSSASSKIKKAVSVHHMMKPLKERFVPKVITTPWKLKTIRRLDWMSIFLFPISYLIFIGVMFATRETW